MRKELLKGLREEQIEKVKSCNDTQEILILAKKEGVELTEEQLDAVSGGCNTKAKAAVCPYCGFSPAHVLADMNVHLDPYAYQCPKCLRCF